MCPARPDTSASMSNHAYRSDSVLTFPLIISSTVISSASRLGSSKLTCVGLFDFDLGPSPPFSSDEACEGDSDRSELSRPWPFANRAGEDGLLRQSWWAEERPRGKTHLRKKNFWLREASRSWARFILMST